MLGESSGAEMVELALRALFESTSKALSFHWNLVQKNIEENSFPEETKEMYLKGCLLVWQNVLQRLCDGCFGKDSESVFFEWLIDYRNCLSKAAASEEGADNVYIKGQIDSFNDYIHNISRLTKSSDESYRKKVEEIRQKQKELEILQSELDIIVWDFSEKEKLS